MLRSFTILAAIVVAVAESCAGQPFCELGRPLYQFFSTREYGGENQNWSAIQNPEGLLFFGNNNFVLGSATTPLALTAGSATPSTVPNYLLVIINGLAARIPLY